MTTALIQAGGKSERMRRTFGPVHKAMIPVMGVPILERNLCHLLARAFKRIVIVTSQAEGEIVDYVSNRGASLAAVRGATIECLVESKPLGTIGAVAMLDSSSCPILVTYSDNVTSLDMRALVEHHEKTGAAATLATHEHPFQIPFGEVVSREGRVVDYREKSVHPILISSGTYVIGGGAHATIAREERIDSPQLVHRLLGRGVPVAEYPHHELWIDVNDADRISEVERLIADNRERLEWLAPQPDRQAYLLVRTARGQLHRTVLFNNCAPSSDNANETSGQRPTIELASFDEIDPIDGRIVRYRVDLLHESGAEYSPAEWLDPAAALASTSGRELRALAYGARFLAAPQAVK